MMGARQCDLFPFTLSIFSIATHFEGIFFTSISFGRQRRKSRRFSRTALHFLRLLKLRYHVKFDADRF